MNAAFALLSKFKGNQKSPELTMHVTIDGSKERDIKSVDELLSYIDSEGFQELARFHNHVLHVHYSDIPNYVHTIELSGDSVSLNRLPETKRDMIETSIKYHVDILSQYFKYGDSLCLRELFVRALKEGRYFKNELHQSNFAISVSHLCRELASFNYKADELYRELVSFIEPEVKITLSDAVDFLCKHVAEDYDKSTYSREFNTSISYVYAGEYIEISMRNNHHGFSFSVKLPRVSY